MGSLTPRRSLSRHHQPAPGSDYWIQTAIRRPGALTEKARREGAITKHGTIRVVWLKRAAKRPGLTGQQARMALTLRELRM